MSERQRGAAGRPESTIVESFSADLDSMFGLSSDSGVDQLSQTVEAKKQTVTSVEQELQQLEAKLRETEQRLARVSRGNSPARPTESTPARSNTERLQATPGAGVRSPSPLAQKPAYPEDRPPTGGRPQNVRGDTQTMMAGMPGAMPQTPGEQYNGSSEYVMVDSGPER